MGLRAFGRLIVGAALLLSIAPARAADVEVPTGRDVVLRGKRTLGDALVPALRAAFPKDAPARPVTLIVDATPYVALAEDDLLAGLLHAEATLGGETRWRIARLGEAVSETRAKAALLAPDLARVLAEDADTLDTMGSLRATLATVPDERPVIVYLADWHFEDDRDVEGLIAALAEVGATLSVIGPEAAFGQAWNDGFFPPDRLSQRNPTAYDPRVGRNPFADDASEGPPWHGGDTAYPHLPGHWFHGTWNQRFTVIRPPPLPPGYRVRPGERLSPKPRKVEHIAVVLPSGFGPWGLMRAAHETGGRYILHGWSSGPGLGVKYDYGRVDLLAPDLRSRAEILAGLRKRPLALAMLQAWSDLATRDVHVAVTSFPIAGPTGPGITMREVQGNGYLAFSWHEPEVHKSFLRRAGMARTALAAALRKLDRAVERAPEFPDDVDRRLLADARLMRHAARSLRFELGEALAASRRIPRDAWKDDRFQPGLGADIWIRAELDPDGQRLGKFELYDEDAGAEVLRERVELLRMYAGTPHAEQIGRNRVDTFHFRKNPYGIGGSIPYRGPDVSDPARPPVTGGSGGASGPATGD